MTDEELRRLAEEWAPEMAYAGPKILTDKLLEFARRVATEAARQERERIYDEAATVTEADWQLLLRLIKGGER